jgi:hypothetical protein
VYPIPICSVSNSHLLYTQFPFTVYPIPNCSTNYLIYMV